MNRSVSKHVQSALSATVLLLCSSAHAESLALTYDVSEKSANSANFSVCLENIDAETLHGVTLDSAAISSTLFFGDIEARRSACVPIFLTWGAEEDPPILEWVARFSDSDGVRRSEVKE